MENLELLAELIVSKLSTKLPPLWQGLGLGLGLGLDTITYRKPTVVAKHLNVSPSTLKRRRQQGIFVLGKHYIETVDKSGRINYLYNLEACQVDIDKLAN